MECFWPGTLLQQLENRTLTSGQRESTYYSSATLHSTTTKSWHSSSTSLSVTAGSSHRHRKDWDETGGREETSVVGDVLVLQLVLVGPPCTATSTSPVHPPQYVSISIRSSMDISIIIGKGDTEEHQLPSRTYSLSKGGGGIYSALLNTFSTPASVVDAAWVDGFLFLLDTQGCLRVWWCGEVIVNGLGYALAPSTSWLGPSSRLIKKFSLLLPSSPILQSASTPAAALQQLPPYWRRGGNVLAVHAGGTPSTHPLFHVTWWDGEKLSRGILAQDSQDTAISSGSQRQLKWTVLEAFFLPSTLSPAHGSAVEHHPSASAELIYFSLVPPAKDHNSTHPDLLICMSTHQPCYDISGFLSSASPSGLSALIHPAKRPHHHHGIGLAMFRRSLATSQSSAYWMPILPPLYCRQWNIVMASLKKFPLDEPFDRMAFFCKQHIFPLDLLRAALMETQSFLVSNMHPLWTHVPLEVLWGLRLEQVCLDMFRIPEGWNMFLYSLSTRLPGYSPFTPELAPYAHLSTHINIGGSPILAIPGRSSYLRNLDAIEALDAVLIGLHTPHMLNHHPTLAPYATSMTILVECLGQVTSVFESGLLEECGKELAKEHAQSSLSLESRLGILAKYFPAVFSGDLLYREEDATVDSSADPLNLMASHWIGLWKGIHPDTLSFVVSLLIPTEESYSGSESIDNDGISLLLMTHTFPQFLSSRYHVSLSLYVWISMLTILGAPEYPDSISPKLVHVLGSIAHSYCVLMEIGKSGLMTQTPESKDLNISARQKGVERDFSRLTLKQASSLSSDTAFMGSDAATSTCIWQSLLQHHYPPLDSSSLSWDIVSHARSFLHRLDLIQSSPNVSCSKGLITLLQKGLAFQWDGRIMDILCTWYPDFRIVSYARGLRCLMQAAHGDFEGVEDGEAPSNATLLDLYERADRAFKICGSGPIEGYDTPGVPHPLVGVRLHKTILDAFDHHIPAYPGISYEAVVKCAIEAAQRGLSLAVLQQEEEWVSYFQKRLAALYLKQRDWASIITLLAVPEMHEDLRRDILKQLVSLLIHYSANRYFTLLIPYAADVLDELMFKCNNMPDVNLLDNVTDIYDLLFAFHMLLGNRVAAAQIKIDFVNRAVAISDSVLAGGDDVVKWTKICQAFLACLSCMPDDPPEAVSATESSVISEFWYHIIPAQRSSKSPTPSKHQVWRITDIRQAYWYSICVLKSLNARRRLVSFSPKEVMEACCIIGAHEDALIMASKFPGVLDVHLSFPYILSLCNSTRAEKLLALQKALAANPTVENALHAAEALFAASKSDPSLAMEQRLPPWLATQIPLDKLCRLYLKHELVEECIRLLQAHITHVVEISFMREMSRSGARLFPVGVFAQVLEKSGRGSKAHAQLSEDWKRYCQVLAEEGKLIES